MFIYLMVLFIEDNMVLGRYLVTNIDVGPDMTAKILKSNGEVVHWSTYGALLTKYLESTEQQDAHEAFDAPVAIKCVTEATVEDFKYLGAVETSEYDM